MHHTIGEQYQHLELGRRTLGVDRQKVQERLQAAVRSQGAQKQPHMVQNLVLVAQTCFVSYTCAICSIKIFSGYMQRHRDKTLREVRLLFRVNPRTSQYLHFHLREGLQRRLIQRADQSYLGGFGAAQLPVVLGAVVPVGARLQERPSKDVGAHGGALLLHRGRHLFLDELNQWLL